MSHAINPEPQFLFCPRCHCQHEDFGLWKTKPHKHHLCLFCGEQWKPFPYTTVGVACSVNPVIWLTLEVFKNMDEYSCTLPTSPRNGRHWRARWPYRLEDHDPRAIHSLGLALSMPNDPPDQISLFWRRILVVEWMAGRELARILGEA
jgi:hypothetical protein